MKKFNRVAVSCSIVRIEETVCRPVSMFNYRSERMGLKCIDISSYFLLCHHVCALKQCPLISTHSAVNNVHSLRCRMLGAYNAQHAFYFIIITCTHNLNSCSNYASHFTLPCCRLVLRATVSPMQINVNFDIFCFFAYNYNLN